MTKTYEKPPPSYLQSQHTGGCSQLGLYGEKLPSRPLETESLSNNNNNNTDNNNNIKLKRREPKLTRTLTQTCTALTVPTP